MAYLSKLKSHYLLLRISFQTYFSLDIFRVWNLEDFDKAENILPHPAYVYTSQFHPRIDTIVVTGCYDQVIRVWDIQGEDVHGNVSSLRWFVMICQYMSDTPTHNTQNTYRRISCILKKVTSIEIINFVGHS